VNEIDFEKLGFPEIYPLLNSRGSSASAAAPLLYVIVNPSYYKMSETNINIDTFLGSGPWFVF